MYVYVYTTVSVITITIITTKAPAAPAMYMMTPCVCDDGGSEVDSLCWFMTDRFLHEEAEVLITQQKDPVSDGVGLPSACSRGFIPTDTVPDTGQLLLVEFTITWSRT